MQLPLLLAPLLLAAPAQAADLTGVYVMADSPEQLQATLDAAVEEAAAEFNPLIRVIARSRLRRATNMCQRYEIRATQTRWMHRCDDDPPLDRAIDAAVVSWKPDEGDPVGTTLTVQGNVSRVVLTGPSGSRTNVFTADATGLSLEVIIASDSLEQPMRWTTRYKRVE